MQAMNAADRTADHFAHGPGPRVLLAWEYGRNYGHVSRLQAVAGLVEQEGGQPVWALPSACLRKKAAFLAPSDACVEAPTNAAARAMTGFGARSFADVLLGHGFGNVVELAIAVRAWMRLFERVDPRGVVIDSAPTAQLAAQLMGLRTFQLTNGFDAPPPECPDFEAGYGGVQAERRNDTRLATLNQNIRHAARLCAGRTDVSAESFFDYPRKVFDGVAETDPYGPRVMQWKVGPLGAPPHVLRAEWLEARAQRKRVLVCMRAMPGGIQLLDALARRDLDTLCAWPHASAEVLSRFHASRVRIVPCALALDLLLPQADAVVSYGPSTFVCASLLAGKPQLMLPMDVEKEAISQCVARRGAGIVWGRDGATVESCLDRLLHAGGLAARAEAIATGYAKVGWEARRAAWGRALMAEETTDLALAL